MRQIRSIREVTTGKILSINEVGDVYGDDQGKQKVLDGMVDGNRYVYDDEEIIITASQAPQYLQSKMDELAEREAKVEAKEIEIQNRFRDLAHKEVAYETKIDEYNKKEIELGERYAHLLSRENEAQRLLDEAKTKKAKSK